LLTLPVQSNVDQWKHVADSKEAHCSSLVWRHVLDHIDESGMSLVRGFGIERCSQEIGVQLTQVFLVPSVSELQAPDRPHAAEALEFALTALRSAFPPRE
jgi:hypothetical protein